MSSYNDLIKKANKFSISRYRSILNNTNILSEDQGTNLISEKIENLKQELKDFSSLKTLTNENFLNVSELFKLQIKDVYLLSNSLELKINEYEIKANTNQNNLVSLLRRIRQKLNTLESFSSNYRNIILEDFSTLQFLFFNITENNQANIDKYAKVATLALDGKPKEIKINDIYIGSDSNGLSGSYYDTDFSNPLNIINSNSNSYYECFKLNEGPLILSLVFELSNEEVINEIRVLPQAKFSNPDFEILDIDFVSKVGNTINIKKLLDINEQTFKIRINELESLNIFKFLPIKATRVNIKFIQKEYSFVEKQKNYSLALKSVSFIQNKYLDSSELQGGTFSLAEGFYSLDAEVKVFPTEDIFKNHYFSFSTKNNSNWNKIEFENNKTPTILHDGSSLNLIYKYSFERLNKAFDNNQTYDSKDYILEVFSKTKTINKEVSPIYIGFNEIFLKKSLKVFQPDIAVRSNRISKAVKLNNFVGPGVFSIELPFDLNKYSIKKNEVKIIVNGNEWSSESNPNSLGDGKYYFSSDNQTLKFKFDNNNFYNVSYLLAEKIPFIYSKPEGYYIKIDEPFDFDKNNIELKVLDSIVYMNTEMFPKGNNFIILEKKFLNKKFFEIKDLENETSYKSEDENFNNFFEVNYLNGNVTLLNQEFINKDLEISYQYFNFKEIDKSKFDIWFNKDEIKGLFISSLEFPLRTISESLLEEDYIFDVLSGGLIKNNKSDQEEKKYVYLKNKSIIKGSLIIRDLFQDYYLNGFYNQDNLNIEEDAKRFLEVDFVDGKTEFSFYKEMKKDIIPAEDIKDNVISGWGYKYLVCRINKSIVLEKKLKLFQDFNFFGEVKSENESTAEDLINKLVSLNDPSLAGVFNNSTKICILRFPEDSSVIEDFYLNYFYIDEEKTNKENAFMFSVDYNNGVLYLSKPIKRNTLNLINCNYKISNMILNYSICNYLTRWNFNEENKNIEVYTEEMISNSNSKLKILYGKSNVSYDLKGLESYFSPLIYKIKIGLN